MRNFLSLILIILSAVTMWNILAIDRWTKYLWTAYRNERSQSINPIGSLYNDESLFFAVGDVLQRYFITTVIIWYPKQQKALQESIDTFIEQLLFIENTLDIKKVDEEYSSVIAASIAWKFKKSPEEDTIVAMKLLEEYLETL